MRIHRPPRRRGRFAYGTAECPRRGREVPCVSALPRPSAARRPRAELLSHPRGGTGSAGRRLDRVRAGARRAGERFPGQAAAGLQSRPAIRSAGGAAPAGGTGRAGRHRTRSLVAPATFKHPSTSGPWAISDNPGSWASSTRIWARACPIAATVWAKEQLQKHPAFDGHAQLLFESGVRFIQPDDGGSAVSRGGNCGAQWAELLVDGEHAEHGETRGTVTARPRIQPGAAPLYESRREGEEGDQPGKGPSPPTTIPMAACGKARSCHRAPGRRRCSAPGSAWTLNQPPWPGGTAAVPRLRR